MTTSMTKFSDLQRIVETIESNLNQFAVRYEPIFYKRLSDDDEVLHRVRQIHCCNLVTAKVIASCSYGLFQIMGYNIYEECEYGFKYFAFVESVSDQMEMFDKFLAGRRINYTWAELKLDRAKLLNFARHYNGNAAVYSKLMLETASKLGL